MEQLFKSTSTPTKMQTPLQILIVEDEFITQKTISNYLIEIGYEIAGLAMSAKEAKEILDTKTVNFIILDINIKGEHNGIWLGNYIKENYNLPFIYLTAYSDNETISNALESEPFSYLVKPFQKHDLLTSIEVSVLNYNKLNPKKDDTLLIKHNEVYKKVIISNINYIESDKNYLKLYCKDDIFRYRSTITDFITLLPKEFIQTHKGFIVNSKKITGFSNSFVEIEKIQIPISKTFKDDVLNTLSL